MANAHPYPIKIDQGGTWTLSLTYKINNAFVNLTNFTASMMVRKNYTDDNPILTLTTANGGIVLGTAGNYTTGLITITASASLTAAMPPGTGVYDLELYTGSEVRKLLRGDVTIVPEVTR
jgi:hypothetical protein